MKELIGQKVCAVNFVNQGIGHVEWICTGTLIRVQEHMICIKVESIARDLQEVGLKDGKTKETWFNTRADTFSRMFPI